MVLNLGTPEYMYKVSGLSTTPQWLLRSVWCVFEYMQQMSKQTFSDKKNTSMIRDKPVNFLSSMIRVHSVCFHNNFF